MTDTHTTAHIPDEAVQAAEAQFTEYFLKNYPKDCIIYNPGWHAPKIFRAAKAAIIENPPHLSAPCAVEVMELNWVEVSYGFIAHTAFGTYKVKADVDQFMMINSGSEFPTSYHDNHFEAKAAAQADFERRILSSVVTKPVDVADADGSMTVEEIRLEDLKQMAMYDGAIVSFECREPYYLASCDHCGSNSEMVPVGSVEAMYPEEYVLHSQAAEIFAAKDAEIAVGDAAIKQNALLWKRAEAAEAELAQYEAQKPVGFLIGDGHFTMSEKQAEIAQSCTTFPVTRLYASPAPAADLKAENEKLHGDLRKLMSGYVNTLENGMDRIRSLGGSCDDLDTMINNDPYLRDARAALNVEASNG